MNMVSLFLTFVADCEGVIDMQLNINSYLKQLAVDWLSSLNFASADWC